MPSISNFVGRFIGFISMVLMGIGFFMLIKTIKKTNRVRASSLLLSMVFSLAMLLFNVLVMRSARIQWWFPLILMFGAGFGFAWGTTTSLNIHEEKILGKRSVLYIYFWLVSIAITQVLALIAETNAVALGLAGMFFSTGASLGTNSNILYRLKHLLASPQKASNINRGIPKKTTKDKYCRNCGYGLKAEENYCMQCGTKIGEDSLDQERIQKKVFSKKRTLRFLIYIAAVPVLVFVLILLVRFFLPDVFPLKVTLGNKQIVLAAPGSDQGEEEPAESVPEVASSENEIGDQDEDEITSTSQNTVRVFIYCSKYGKSPVEASQDDEIIVYDGWGAKNEDLLEDYINNIIRDIHFDGKKIEYDTISEILPYYDDQGNFEGYNVFFEKNIGKLSPGTHIVEGVVSWKQKIYDGWDYFGPGTDNETAGGFCEIIVN